MRVVRILMIAVLGIAGGCSSSRAPQLSVTVDVPPTEASHESPAREFVLRGRVHGPSGTRVEVDGREAMVRADGTFELSVDLEPLLPRTVEIVAVHGDRRSVPVSRTLYHLDPEFEALARTSTARSEVSALLLALLHFKRLNARYPTADEGLDAVKLFLDGEAVPKDPWGNDYVYETDGWRVVVSSLGADGAPGGDGEARDIRSDDE